jgi:hypothetical protein
MFGCKYVGTHTYVAQSRVVYVRVCVCVLHAHVVYDCMRACKHACVVCACMHACAMYAHMHGCVVLDNVCMKVDVMHAVRRVVCVENACMHAYTFSAS